MPSKSGYVVSRTGEMGYKIRRLLRKSGDLTCMQILQSLILMTVHVHDSIAEIYGAKIPVNVFEFNLIIFQDGKLDVLSSFIY